MTRMQASRAPLVLQRGVKERCDPIRATSRSPTTAAARQREADTSTLVSSLTAPEWEQFCTRFLFLTPPTDSFSSSELGEILASDGF